MSPFRAIFCRSLATSLLLAMAAVFPARGQTAVEWTGASNSTWSTTSNWTSVTSPNYPNNSGEIAVFNGSWSNTSRQPTIGNTGYTIGGIVVESDVPTTLTLAGGTGTLTINPSGWSGTVGIDNQSIGAETIGAKLALGSDQTWQASNVNGGGWTFSSTIALSSHTLTLNAANAANTIAANGVISGAGSLAGIGCLDINHLNRGLLRQKRWRRYARKMRELECRRRLDFYDKMGEFLRLRADISRGFVKCRMGGFASRKVVVRAFQSGAQCVGSALNNAKSQRIAARPGGFERGEAVGVALLGGIETGQMRRSCVLRFRACRRQTQSRLVLRFGLINGVAVPISIPELDMRHRVLGVLRNLSRVSCDGAFGRACLRIKLAQEVENCGVSRSNFERASRLVQRLILHIGLQICFRESEAGNRIEWGQINRGPEHSDRARKIALRKQGIALAQLALDS